MISLDPFHAFRKTTAIYDSVTGSDGRSLALISVDPSAFYRFADQAIEIANRHGWRCSIRRLHPGARIVELTITLVRAADPRLPPTESALSDCG